MSSIISNRAISKIEFQIPMLFVLYFEIKVGMYFNSGIFLQFLWTVFWKHCYYETLILGAAATAKGKLLKIKLDIF